VLTPVDFSHYESALATPAGWIDLALVAVCFAAGWLLDRRVSLKSASGATVVKAGLGGVNRLLLPLTTLVLLLVAAAVFRHWQPPFFIAIALPLTVALALVRLMVYALRGLFGTPTWLPASERVISFAIWALVLLYFTGVLQQVSTELDALQIPLGSKHVSVYEILKGAIVVVLAIAGTLWLSGVFEQRLARAAHLDSNVRAVLTKALRALLLVLGLLFSLQAVGIDLTLLTVFGGALGVGIGLGLQKLASNYISGFTILLDRSIRLGDMITVDNRHGVVTAVTSRYVVVRSLDGVEAIVPNDTLVTTTVLNHSYTSKDVRIGIPVQVSYDSDVDLALKLMEEAAAKEPRVLKAPNRPAAFIVRFADSGIDLELGVWIADPEKGQLDVKSAINRAIWQAFQAGGIKIPYPQREMRILNPVAADTLSATGSRQPEDSPG
jgi:small-conductance mechanosensitive channel